MRDKWERSNRANGSPGSVASTTEHGLHRLRRGLLNPFFSKGAVMQLERSTVEKVDLLCEKLRECAEDEKVVDLGAAFTALTLDVISEYSYDEYYNCLEQPDFAPHWKRLMSGLFEAVPVAKHFPWFMKAMLSLPRAFSVKLNPDFGPFLESKDAIDKQAREIWLVEQSATSSKSPQSDEKAKTLFHYIIRSNLPAQEKSIERLSDEAFILIVAGGETTARVLTIILSHLLQNGDLFARLRKDLDTVMNPDLPESRVLEEIPLMKAVIQEGLRVAAPVVNRPILIALDEDLNCHGYAIPHSVRQRRTY